MGLMGMMGVGMGWTADNGHPRKLLLFMGCLCNVFSSSTLLRQSRHKEPTKKGRRKKTADGSPRGHRGLPSAWLTRIVNSLCITDLFSSDSWHYAATWNRQVSYILANGSFIVPLYDFPMSVSSATHSFYLVVFLQLVHISYQRPSGYSQGIGQIVHRG